MKFTIRDLFLVTMIVALAVAWWLDHRRQTTEIKKLKEQLLIMNFAWADPPTSSAPATKPLKP